MRPMHSTEADRTAKNDEKIQWWDPGLKPCTRKEHAPTGIKTSGDKGKHVLRGSTYICDGRAPDQEIVNGICYRIQGTNQE